MSKTVRSANVTRVQYAELSTPIGRIYPAWSGNTLLAIAMAETKDRGSWTAGDRPGNKVHSLRRELDFAAECRSAERIARNFEGRDDIVVPKVYWQWTCERLNVQEMLEGVPGRDLAAVDALGLDRRALARTGAGLVLKMVLEDGFFHADPHPGNIFYMPGGAIGLRHPGSCVETRLCRSRRLASEVGAS